MKIFQIAFGICHYDMTPLYRNAEDARQFYPPDSVIVDAPDYVFEGWGFDETAEGENRFIKPTPPEGFAYSDEYGCFYEIGKKVPEDVIPPEERLKMRIAELENALCDLDAANEEAHATYETALCDLDETLNGGTV